MTVAEQEKSDPPSRPATAADSRSGDDDPLGIFGRTIAGRFAVVRYLGSTSVAHIYRAVHTLMEQPCFLKIAPADEVPAARFGHGRVTRGCVQNNNNNNNFDLPKGTFARRVAATGLLAAGGRGGSPKTALMAHTHTHTEPPYPEQG